MSARGSWPSSRLKNLFLVTFVLSTKQLYSILHTSSTQLTSRRPHLACEQILTFTFVYLEASFPRIAQDPDLLGRSILGQQTRSVGCEAKGMWGTWGTGLSYFFRGISLRGWKMFAKILFMAWRNKTYNPGTCCNFGNSRLIPWMKPPRMTRCKSATWAHEMMMLYTWKSAIFFTRLAFSILKWWISFWNRLPIQGSRYLDRNVDPCSSKRKSSMNFPGLPTQKNFKTLMTLRLIQDFIRMFKMFCLVS